jgi:hypothetical protein
VNLDEQIEVALRDGLSGKQSDEHAYINVLFSFN